VFVDSSGLSPCCNTVNKFGLGTTIEEYKNHPQLLEFQKQFLDGESPLACHNCQLQEKIQNKSMRTDAVADYDNKIFTTTKLDFIHYSQSNICNFKCRSCAPKHSHGIAKEQDNHPSLRPAEYKPPIKKIITITEDNQDWIIANIKDIRRLLLTGGEPTVMPEVRKIFEYLKKYPQDQLQIMMTTNGSWTDAFWYDIIQSSPNLHITVSVDGVGPAAELIRHGTVWSQVEYNLRWLVKNAYSLDINTVVSRLNILNLYSLLKLCRELSISSMHVNGGKQGDLGLRHQFTICSIPRYMAINNWPDNFKPKILEHLNGCLTLDLDNEQRKMVEGIITVVNTSKFDKKSWDATEQYQIELDRVRNEDHTSLLPTAI
jgi:pyruvate-formate lyase-activating enzyme